MWGEGTVLAGRYQLRRRIGGGSMGDVWRALDTVLGREVAVKILLPALLDDAGFAARFHTEARVLAALSHPGIVSVFDYGEADDPRTTFLVMELISGRPLSDLLDESAPLSEATTLTVVAQTLEALQAAHDRGIVHRDVKPANLMLRGGSVVVTDFGVARTADARRLTAADVVLGTAVYAAPEQARHTAVTAAADQYAVGVIAYECLTGTPPFDGGTPLGIMMKHLQEPVPPLPETVSAPVRELVMRALAKDPAERFASAREMAEAARRLAAGDGGVKRIGMPQDSFQTGVDVAGVEAAAAAAGLGVGGAGAGARGDGDFLSFVVVPRGDEDEGAEDGGSGGGSAELSAAGGEAGAAADSEAEEIAPAWASYAVRPQVEGADWASFTVRGRQEEETVPLPDGEAAEEAAEAAEPKAQGATGRVVPQDSFTAGVEIDATAVAPAAVGRWRSRAVPQDSFTAGVELDEEPVETGRPARGGLGGRWRRRNSSASAAPQEEVLATDPIVEQAESTADPIGDPDPEPAPEPAPRIAPGHAMPLDSFNAGVELDPEDDAPSSRVVPQDSFTVLGSDDPESTESEPEPEPAASAQPGRRRAAVLAAVGAVVVVVIAVAYPLSHSNSSANAAAPSTSAVSATSVTSEASTSSSPSQPPTSSALVPPPVASSSSAVPHKTGYITNVGDGDVIDVFGNSTGSPIFSDGASLTVEPQSGRIGQKFQATALTSNGQAVYEFGDGLNTNQLIDGSGGSGGSVRLEHCACGSPAQMWWLSQDSGMPGGAFAIHNQGANLCLTDNGASNALSLKPCVVGNKAQQWYLP